VLPTRGGPAPAGPTQFSQAFRLESNVHRLVAQDLPHTARKSDVVDPFRYRLSNYSRYTARQPK